MKRLVAIAAFVLTAVAPAFAQQQAPPCSAPEFRQLDFWVGEWDVSWETSPGQPGGGGVNVITRQLGDCVIQEDFIGGPTTGNLVGRSVSIYDTASSAWRPTWVDNQGGHFALTGGPVGDTFVLERLPLSASAPQQRMVFEDITPDAFTWRWQRRAGDTAAWSDSWVIQYTRRSP